MEKQIGFSWKNVKVRRDIEDIDAAEILILK
jgi:hypothetical protein